MLPNVSDIVRENDFERMQPWQYRWLAGHEYHDMLSNWQHYSARFDFAVLNDHPNDIYYTPQNGCIYYLRKQTLRKLGFPRLLDNQKKVYKWKKMNFQTLLPKSRPLVVYIVCSTTCTESSYRMHIVQLVGKDPHQYLLCHLLQMEPRQMNKVEKPLYSIARSAWVSQQKEESIVPPINAVNQHLLETIRVQREDLQRSVERYREHLKPMKLEVVVPEDREHRCFSEMELESPAESYDGIMKRAVMLLDLTEKM